MPRVRRRRGRMVADVDERLRRRAAAPRRELDVADVRGRARRLRRSRRLWSTAGVVVVVAVISLGATILLGDRGPQVVLDRRGGVEPHTVERPADGEVEPITAPDGEPALLIGDGDDVRAVRAVDHMDAGMDELVMWCAPAEVFVTPSAFSSSPAGSTARRRRARDSGVRSRRQPARVAPQRVAGRRRLSWCTRSGAGRARATGRPSRTRGLRTWRSGGRPGCRGCPGGCRPR